jgi:hypothetical protein
MAASSNPLQRGSRRWGAFIHENHAARWENGSSWWGCLCDMCFTTKTSSEREIFVPTRTHLVVKLSNKTLEYRPHPTPSKEAPMGTAD